jgi:hypothetical protein
MKTLKVFETFRVWINSFAESYRLIPNNREDMAYAARNEAIF